MYVQTAFLLRGFMLNATTADDDFTELRKAVALKGCRVVPVPITWNRKTISQFVGQFVDLYSREKSAYNVIIGGSFGAMAAFVAAPQVKPDRLILCSLSAFFGEDLNKYDENQQRRYQTWLGKRRWQDFKTLSADAIAHDINKTPTEITMLYGELEKAMHPQLVSRVKSTAAKLDNSQLIEVPNCGHIMRTPEYIAGIRRVL